MYLEIIFAVANGCTRLKCVISDTYLNFHPCCSQILKIPFWSQPDIGPKLSRGGRGLQRFGNVPKFNRFLVSKASLINFPSDMNEWQYLYVNARNRISA